VSLVGTVTTGDGTMHVTLRGPRETVWTLAKRLTIDAAAVLALGQELALGVMRAARRVPARDRRNALAEIKDTAAAVYLLLTWREHTSSVDLPEEVRARRQAVAQAIDAAERECRTAYTTVWTRSGRAEQRCLLTAFLVHRAYRDRWADLGRLDPFAIPRNTASSFRRRYLSASILTAVRATLDDPRSRSALLEGHDPRIRLVFGASLPPR
jgi:hypothetical protein